MEEYVYYYNKTGLFMIWNDDGGGSGGRSDWKSYHLLKNGKDNLKLISYQFLQNGRIIEESYNTGGELDFENGISRGSFQNKLRSLTKGKKAAKIKYYKNTASNRKKYLK